MGKFIVGINEKTNFKQIETINNIENILKNINNRLISNQSIDGDRIAQKRYDESFKQNFISLIKELNRFDYLAENDEFPIPYFNISNFTVKCKYVISAIEDIQHSRDIRQAFDIQDKIINVSNELLDIRKLIPTLKSKYIEFLNSEHNIVTHPKNNKEIMPQDNKEITPQKENPTYGFRVKELKNKLVRLSEHPEEKKEGEKMSPIYPNMTDKDANSIYFEIQKYIKEFPNEEGLQDIKDEFESGKNKAAGIKYWYKKLYNAFNKRESLKHLKWFKNF